MDRPRHFRHIVGAGSHALARRLHYPVHATASGEYWLGQRRVCRQQRREQLWFVLILAPVLAAGRFRVRAGRDSPRR